MLHRASLPDFLFPSGFDAALDWAAWLQLARRPGDFVYVREPLVHRRVHVSSATHVHLASRVEEDERILRSLWPGPIAGLIGRLYAAGRRRYESGPLVLGCNSAIPDPGSRIPSPESRVVRLGAELCLPLDTA